MKSMNNTQDIVEVLLEPGFDPMFGAAIISEDGQEMPITMDMVNECLNSFVAREEYGHKSH